MHLAPCTLHLAPAPGPAPPSRATRPTEPGGQAGKVGTGLGQSQGREGSSEADDLPVPIRLKREGATERLQAIPRKAPRGLFWYLERRRPGIVPQFRPRLGINDLSSVSPAFKLMNVQSLFGLVPRALQPSSGMPPWPSLNSTRLSSVLYIRYRAPDPSRSLFLFLSLPFPLVLALPTRYFPVHRILRPHPTAGVCEAQTF